MRRWTQQLAKSRSREIPGSDELAEELATRVPTSQRACVVHGDYRLDNVIVGPGEALNLESSSARTALHRKSPAAEPP